MNIYGVGCPTSAGCGPSEMSQRMSSGRPVSRGSRPPPTAIRGSTALSPGGSSMGVLSAQIRVADRPVTQQGLSGIKTSTRGPQRQVLDKSYYLGLLRSKVSELSMESSKLQKDVDAFNQENSVYLNYEKRAELLAGEIKDLQGQLADYNTLVDKLNTHTEMEEVLSDIITLKAQNDREAQSIDVIFTRRREKEAQMEAVQSAVLQQKEAALNIIREMNPDDQNTHSLLKNRNEQLIQELETQQEELNALLRRKEMLEGDLLQSQGKQESVVLHEKLLELQNHREELKREEESTGSREKLLTQVKENNQEISSLETQYVTDPRSPRHDSIIQSLSLLRHRAAPIVSPGGDLGTSSERGAFGERMVEASIIYERTGSQTNQSQEHWSAAGFGSVRFRRGDGEYVKPGETLEAPKGQSRCSDPGISCVCRLSELREKISVLNEELRQMDSEEQHGERTLKYKELQKKEQEIDVFLEAFEESKAQDLQLIRDTQSSITALLEHCSRNLSRLERISSVSSQELQIMQDDLNFKENEMQKSQSTARGLSSGLLQPTSFNSRILSSISPGCPREPKRFSVRSSGAQVFLDAEVIDVGLGNLLPLSRFSHIHRVLLQRCHKRPSDDVWLPPEAGSSSLEPLPESERLQQDLLKVDQLEGKVTTELQTLREDLRKMREDLETYRDLEALRTAAEQRRKAQSFVVSSASTSDHQLSESVKTNVLHSFRPNLICRCTRLGWGSEAQELFVFPQKLQEELLSLAQRKHMFKKMLQKLSDENELLRSQLQENEVHVELSNMERKWQHHEQNNHLMKEFIASRAAESDYQPLVKSVQKQLQEFNRILQGARV
ncbi:hypothetical protein DNTS_005236 [Danionella cerebrum]|uniref:Uncharacterized protein n=1 Tax=Danionella cerebrum TaxID=2873325 RepID=A0A553QDE1_9TELE|nr:hypothetical protein DNTS_005236 [Danionella translucida]